MSEPQFHPEAMRAEISESIYQACSQAARLAQHYQEMDPNMLDAIADGIIRFLADGDVYEQVIRTIIASEPALIKRCLDAETDAVLKQLDE